MGKAEDFIARAEEAERVARQLSLDAHRQELLQLARRYRLLAARCAGPAAPDAEEPEEPEKNVG